MPSSDEEAPARVTPGRRGHSHGPRFVSEGMTTTDATSPLQPLARRRTALLTSFKRDGTPVDTPVTIAVEDGHAYIRTYDRAWKARRMRKPSRGPARARDGPRPPARRGAQRARRAAPRPGGRARRPRDRAAPADPPGRARAAAPPEARPDAALPRHAGRRPAR